MKNRFEQLDELKQHLNQLGNLQSDKVVKAFDIEYTYESNKIEGNTLTLQETALVIEKGLTIGGKSLNEHLEAVNHQHAIDYIKDLAKQNETISERELLQIHYLVLQGINNNQAGKYRNLQVLISGAKHVPPQPFLVPKEMENLFLWYNENKDKLHPVVLSAEMHERLVTIHPFIDGNGRTARALFYWYMLKNGYWLTEYLSISKVIKETKVQYEKAYLYTEIDGNDLGYFITYHLKK